MISLILLSGCSVDQGESEVTSANNIETPDRQIWNYKVTMSTNGKKTAEVKSGYMEQYFSRSVYELSDSVEVNFYDENENHTSVLNSDKAQVNQNLDLLIAIDNVSFLSDSGYTLFTDTLYWDNTKGLLYTKTEFMMISEDGDTTYGTDLKSDRLLHNITFKEMSGVIIIK
ncbi:LPS export ABC transporter periplasmic protein LptC [candidate division KSB1 bacterium]